MGMSRSSGTPTGTERRDLDGPKFFERNLGILKDLRQQKRRFSKPYASAETRGTSERTCTRPLTGQIKEGIEKVGRVTDKGEISLKAAMLGSIN